MKTIFTSSFVLLFIFFGVSQEFELEEFATGFSNPTAIVNAGDSRLFVANQNGIINVVNENGIVNNQPFLNIESLIDFNLGEDGLLGIAFHPNYSENGCFFINYINLEGNTVISRYSVSDNPDIANPNGEIILTIDQPTLIHNGGDMHFGPDGYLWISVGDGGNAGGPDDNGIYSQNINSLLGKILRIDVTEQGYISPPDNPFIGVDGADEIWAYGLRNAWKFSFDSETHEVWIADVGQNVMEEINKQHSSEAGLNYGWRCYEGNNIYNNSDCPSPETMIFPVATYNLSDVRCSIIGGYVYRGDSYVNLIGKYFFADYCSREIGWVDENDNLEFLQSYPELRFTSFGQDVNGEMYVASRNEGADKILKIVGEVMGVKDSDRTKISIYPNPTTQFVNITSNQKVDEVSIYSIEGKLLQTLKGNLQQIDLSKYPNGVYMITIQSGKITKTHKVVKK